MKELSELQEHIRTSMIDFSPEIESSNITQTGMHDKKYRNIHIFV